MHPRWPGARWPPLAIEGVAHEPQATTVLLVSMLWSTVC